MTKNEQLSKAITLAVAGHYGQYDKGGNPYILHPLHLMNQLLFDKELAAIAVMHDLIEDTDMTIKKLKAMGFSERVTDALVLLTHVNKEPYEVYIKKMFNNIDAIRVKRKDLEHNSDITRLKGVTDKDLERMRKYHEAFIQLGDAKRSLK